MSGITSVMLQSVLYAMTNQQPLVCPGTEIEQCSLAGDLIELQALPEQHNLEQQPLLIASPDNFSPKEQFPPPLAVPKPIAPRAVPPAPTPAATSPPQPKPTPLPTPTPEVPQPATLTSIKAPPRLTRKADQVAARQAWKYFERNWNPQTGFVNSVDNLPWTTWWDQGSALLGIHAARQLGLLPQNVFQRRMNTLLHTLETLPLPATGLPNKAYNTRTA